jgi:hypothetical protein
MKAIDAAVKAAERLMFCACNDPDHHNPRAVAQAITDVYAGMGWGFIPHKWVDSPRDPGRCVVCNGVNHLHISERDEEPNV